MKIKLDKIISDKFQVREKLDQEHLESIKDSMEKDGQWNPVIVRPTSDGFYDLIGGHYRFESAKQLDWSEIEATIKDIEDQESRILALKTNLLSKDMSEIEQGKILKLIMEKDGMNQKELSKKIGKGTNWVSRRLSLVLDIHKDVKRALDAGIINFKLIPVIGTLEKDKQPEFLKCLSARNITDDSDARKIRDNLFNDTIFTIGYSGKRSIEFLNILNDNKIKTVIDIRYNTSSQYKPDFNRDILKRELERSNIKYLHQQDFGVPSVIREAVIEGFDSECFRKWYRWYATQKNDISFNKLFGKIKESGKSVLLCAEAYPRPKNDQKQYCHRDFLADLVVEFSQQHQDETMHFTKRIDL